MSFLDKLFPKGPDAETNFQLAFEEETKYNNYEKAMQYYEKAANQGLAKAQYYCGYMYLKGRGAKKNYERAVELVTKSAQQNYPHGQYLLAQMYLSGEGVEKNEELGNEWMEKYKAHNLPNKIVLCFHNY